MNAEGRREKTSWIRSLTAVGAFAAAAVLPASAFAQEAAEPEGGAQGEAPAASTLFEIERAEIVSDEDGVVLEVRGGLDVPDGAIVTLAVKFGEEIGRKQRTEVNGGKFSISERSGTTVIPGPYELEIAFAASQPRAIGQALSEEKRTALKVPFVKTIFVGDAAQEGEARKLVRKKYNDLLEECRAIFLTLSQYESFLFYEIGMKLIEKRAELLKEGKPREEIDKADVDPKRLRTIQRNWVRAKEELWEQRFANLRFDWKQYKNALFMQPYPSAVTAFENLLSEMVRWYAKVAGQLHTRLGMKMPPEVEAQGDQPIGSRTVRYKAVKDTARRVYEALGAKVMPQWEPLDAASAESGVLIGDDKRTYRSWISKFQVALPKNPEWRFDFRDRPHPTARLRLRPSADLKTAIDKQAVVAVEFRDYPTAENFDDIAQMSKVGAPARFPGYKEISTKDIKAVDPTMPGGKRPGLDKIFTSKSETGKTFWVRHYELFCRWHKRTYGLVCIVPEGEEKSYEKDFEDIIRSFKVLDAPKFQNFREEERERLRQREEEGLLLPPEND